MLYNATSIFSEVFLNFSSFVFGSNVLTAIMIFFLFFLMGILFKIPLSLNLALFVPLSIILMVMGFLPLVVGGSLVVILMVLTGISFVSSF